ncbi:MAG: hypothetical protein FJ135_01635 [Deltaproteobacteria bacterium]|nr:hypothetical protein [Deltaproteobacteria bacterium]
MQIIGIDLGYILLAAGAAVFWLLLREFNCWYWKINERLALLEDIVARLERLEAQQPPPPTGRQFPEINID